MQDIPLGTVTFLLGDVEGSTKLWEQHPNEMWDAVATYYRIASEVNDAHGGFLVKSRGEGDSVFIVFTKASQALDCALEMQARLVQEMWDAKIPIRVRFSLNTGEADYREGDYYGHTVNRSARLRGVAHGGQVVLSRVTVEQIREALPEGASLKDLGFHRLKDLAQPEHVFQLCHSDLPGEFPPLRSLESRRHNLPVQLTSFVGREDEIEEAKDLLSSHRLITLTGAGGSGKTRLALQLAAEVTDDFADGVWLTELALVSEPPLVPQAVAAALGLRDGPGQTLLDSLIEYLRSRKVLLLLDNCEHLVSACADLAGALLGVCPGLKILATSREVLGTRGETIHQVPSLSIPDERVWSPEGLASLESVRLFVERAAASRPSFQLEAENADAIAQICRRLDGIPLAIELAAPWVKVLSCRQIAARLNDRFRLLTGAGRGRLGRQQTLRASVDWSYELLSEPERVLFRRLSVFAGGFTLERAEDVCGWGKVGREEVLGLVSQLVDKSLLLMEHDGRSARYRIIETIREYGREKLIESGESREMHARHRDCYLELTERAEPELHGADQKAWLDLLETEMENLRAALSWSVIEGETEALIRLAAALWRFWYVHGHFIEGRNWLDQAHAAAEGPSVVGAARVINAAALLAHGQGDYGTAGALAESALAKARRSGDVLDEGFALLNLGLVKGSLGEFERARSLIEQVLELARVRGAEAGVAASGVVAAVNTLGALAQGQGDFATARAFFEEGLAYARGVGDVQSIADSLARLGLLTSWEGDLENARLKMEEALAISRDLGDRVRVAVLVGDLGELERVRGNLERARSLMEEAIDSAREHGDKMRVAVLLGGLGDLERTQGNYVRARSLMQEGLRFVREQGHRWNTARALCGLGFLALDEDDRVAAREALEEGLAIARNSGDLLGLARALHGLGVLDSREGELDRAGSLFQESLSITRQSGFTLGIAQLLLSLGELSRVRGDYGESELQLSESLSLLAGLGAGPDIIRCLEQMAALAAARQRPDVSARLIGAAATLRESMEAPVPPALRTFLNEIRAAARTALAHEADTFFDEGRSLSLEEAVAAASAAGVG